MGRLRVGVVGAAGRMGAESCRAVDAADDLDLVAAVSPRHGGQDLGDVTGVGGGVTVLRDVSDLSASELDVAVDFTTPDAVATNVERLLDLGIHAVVGTSGLGADALRRLADLASGGAANVLVAPNFALGAVLMMRFAAEAARHLPHVEIVERHHDRKADAPSGTALRTAELVADARTRRPDVVLGERLDGARGADHHGLRVHSLRLPGSVAHQEVVFGGAGETLTIRHDSIDRRSFMPGVLMAIRRVGELDGLVVGLEHVLD